jgi:hypothetical protein
VVVKVTVIVVFGELCILMYARWSLADDLSNQPIKYSFKVMAGIAQYLLRKEVSVLVHESYSKMAIFVKRVDVTV